MITLNDLYTEERFKEMDLFDLADFIQSKVPQITYDLLVGSTTRDKARNLYMRLHPITTENKIRLVEGMGVVSATLVQQKAIIIIARAVGIKVNSYSEEEIIKGNLYGGIFYGSSITRQCNSAIKHPVTFSEFIQAILNEPEKQKEVEQ